MVSTTRQNSKLPFVSVVVPTLNRKKDLTNCLESLLKSDYPDSKFEVIVVDGGSSDGTKELVEKKFPKVNLIIDKRRGASCARNTGEKNAKGEILAYTDDDCVVDRGWLKKLVSGFISPKIGGVGGPTFWLNTKLIPEKFKEGPPLGPFHLGEKMCPVNDLITSNLAIRHDVFKKTKFDASLRYAEDIDFCMSLREAGYKLLYIPDAKVYHNINPKRATLKYILKRAFFAGISLYMVYRKRKSKGVLIVRFLRSTLSRLIFFFYTRKIADLYWLIKCFVAFLASIY